MNRGNAGHVPNRKGINFKFKNLQQTQKLGGRKGGPHANGKQNNIHTINDYFCSHSKVMQMGSKICSLILMRSNENYLLARAMNGVIQQWDRRMVENGGVRTFEGNYNTHTTLQLGVDPIKTFLVSGGEDSVVRIWSLASGRLLHQEKSLSSPASCVCWPPSLGLQSQL